MTAVMIGIDPHKASHTAVAISAAEEELGELRVRACAGQAEQRRLRQRGYQVFAVNPNADQVEGDTCYHDLKSVPGGVDWVLIGTKPQRAEATMRECADLGIKRVWMHRGPGAGSVHKKPPGMAASTASR